VAWDARIVVLEKGGNLAGSALSAEVTHENSIQEIKRNCVTEDQVSQCLLSFLIPKCFDALLRLGHTLR
jgi:hypothetical protein